MRANNSRDQDGRTVRASRAAWGLGTDLAGTLTAIGVTLVTTPLLLRLLSGSAYGFWVTSLQVMSVLGLLDFGLGTGLLRLGSDPAEHEPGRFDRLVSTAFFSSLAMGAVIAACGFAITPVIPSLFKIPPNEAREVQRALALSVTATAIALPLSAFPMVLRSFHHLALANLLGTGAMLLSTATALVLLFLGVGLIALPLGTITGVVVMGLTALALARRYAQPFTLRPGLVDRQSLRQLWSYSATLQGGRIAHTVATNTDAIVISTLLNVAAVTPYSLTMKLPNMLGAGLASKIPSQLMSTIAELYAVGDRERLRRSFLALTGLMIRFGFLAASLVWIADEAFLNVWVGPGHFGGWWLAGVGALLVLVDWTIRGTSVFLWMSPAVGKFARVSAIEAVANLGCSAVLVWYFGIVGAAMGSLLSRTLITGPYQAYSICTLLNISKSDYLIVAIGSPLLKSLPTFAVAWTLWAFLPETASWAHLVLVSGLCLGVNVLVFDVPGLLRSPDPIRPSTVFRALLPLG